MKYFITYTFKAQWYWSGINEGGYTLEEAMKIYEDLNSHPEIYKNIHIYMQEI